VGVGNTKQQWPSSRALLFYVGAFWLGTFVWAGIAISRFWLPAVLGEAAGTVPPIHAGG